jgi:AcrR family transcriptional regulator
MQQMLCNLPFLPLRGQPSKKGFCCLSNSGAEMLPIELEEKLDPRAKRTRHLIEQAFMELLIERGFQTVSIQDITERAGVNRSTFYAHFQDKYALLDHSIRQGFLQEIDKRMLNACRFSMDNIHNLIIGVCEFIKNNNAHCQPPQKKFESLVEAQVKLVLYEVLLKWLSELPIDIAPETAATAASWAIYGLALQWSHSEQPQALDEFANQVLPLIVSNLRLAETS